MDIKIEKRENTRLCYPPCIFCKLVKRSFSLSFMVIGPEMDTCKGSETPMECMK